jgi:mRNA-degrading endonuclease RelE of RelBE toxin-antitoxin system
LPQPAFEVNGTARFVSKFASLNRKDDLWKSIDACLDELKSNAQAGVKIPRNLWPGDYTRNYGVTNLYKCNLAGAYRLLYTIYVESGRVKVLAIDFMPHKEYEKLFGY